MAKHRHDEIDPGDASSAPVEDSRAHQITALKREESSMQKLIAAMAKRAYGFDPNAVRSGVARRIVDDCLLLGITIDHDTVLKHLRESAKRLLEND